MTTAATPLNPDRVYLVGDRFACGTVRCAGATAVFSGRDLNGRNVRAVDSQDVAEWATYDLGPVRCECGAVTKTA